MKLLSLHVEGFGRLSELDMRFDGGLNCLHRKNGWGKSTLAVFIKAMLYGLPATSKRSLDENERKKYRPWQGGAYGGSLEFECAKGRFRVERFFGDKESADSFALYDLSTNMPSDVFGESLGESLFGIDGEGFERSTYLSQRNVRGRGEGSLAAKLGNLLDDVGDIGDYESAMAALDKRRKYYVMSGNRGRIAELEREELQVLGELERAERVEEALRVQEGELAECRAESESVQKTAEENRRLLEEAGLARERGALLEQRAAMQGEIDRLAAQAESIRACFGGAVPTLAEWSEASATAERIKALHLRMEAASKSAESDRAELARVAHFLAAGTPTADLLEHVSRENEGMRRLCAKREAIEGLQDPTLQRASERIPREEELRVMQEKLYQAQSLRESTEHTAHRSSPAVLIMATVLLVLGSLAMGLSLLPSLATLAVPILLGAGGCLLTGVILLAVGVRSRSRQRRARGKETRARQERAEALLGEVKRFLLYYGMRGEHPMRELTELSALAVREREMEQTRAEQDRSVQEISRRIAEGRARIRAALVPYFGELPEKQDYRTELERLRQSAERLAQLKHVEQERAHSRAAAEAEMKQMKDSLQPLLHRYLAQPDRNAFDRLKGIGERILEYRRIETELERRRTMLDDFVSKKKLGDDTRVVSAAEYDRLRDGERALRAKRENLQNRCASMHMHIERLSEQTDRIPELQETLVNLRERIAEAKANAKTIQATARLLEEAKLSLSTRYLDGMQTAFRRYLATVTREEAPESVMDTSFDVSLREGGKTRSMESFSRGWRDAVEFCVRLSLAEALYDGEERPFLLLDDPFVNLDDDRLRAARQLLDELAKEYQILYFVCREESASM